jgi:hypothetical protein
LIDVENFTDTGDSACAVSSPLYSIMYHDGAGYVPTEGDHIYKDDKGTEVFMGGNLWYNIDPSTYSIKIDELR